MDLGQTWILLTPCPPRYCPLPQKALGFLYFSHFVWWHGQCAWLRQGCGRSSLWDRCCQRVVLMYRMAFRLWQGCTAPQRRMCNRTCTAHRAPTISLSGPFLCLDAVALETGFHYPAQAGFELTVLLSQLPGCWDYRFVLLSVGFIEPFSGKVCSRHGVLRAVS